MTRRPMWITALVFAAGSTLAGQTPQTTSPKGPVIRGTVVVDDGSGSPVRRAAVSLRDGDTGAAKTQVADDDGRFEFHVLPRMRFSIGASRPGFVARSYSSMDLPPGQSELVVRIRLARVAAISGRVTDPLGRPLPSAQIEIFAVKGPVQIPGALLPFEVRGRVPAVSEANGDYRYWGLPPGRYVVRVTQQTPSETLRLTTPEELAWAKAPGLTAHPAPVFANGLTESGVYYPGVLQAGEATVLVIAAGEDRSGINLVVPFARRGGH